MYDDPLIPTNNIFSTNIAVKTNTQPWWLSLINPNSLN